MKKIKNLIVFLLILLLSITFFSFDKPICAETFYKYDIEVKLRNDGTAEFTSYIDLEPTKGTEYYFPIENLGLSEIKNFRVFEMYEGEYKEYTFVDNWDIKASRKEKANKNGLIRTSKGYELAFGIGDYTRKTFMLKYEVTDFVKILNDSDMFFWRFVNDKMSAAPQKVKVIIEKDGEYISNENSKIWAFGTDGEIKLENGKIEFNNFKPLRNVNYVTILSKFDKGLFEGGEKIDKNFEYYKNLAFDGSSYKNSYDFIYFLKVICIYLLKIMIFIYIFLKVKKFFTNYRGGYKKRDLKGEYYRTIPEKQWWKLSKILKSCNFNDEKCIINAFFLKWIQEGDIIPILEKDAITEEDYSIQILYKDNFDSELEMELYQIMELASGDDKILQKNEFSKFLNREENLRKFKHIMNLIEMESDIYIEENSFIYNGTIGKKYNPEGRKFTGKIVKYYNYLKDFTILDEREIKEIKVWKELLIYATLFGIADTVTKRLENLSPESLTVVEDNMKMDIAFLSSSVHYSGSFYNRTITSYNRAVSRGDGGNSSSGGGLGSFGGGSGGGSR